MPFKKCLECRERYYRKPYIYKASKFCSKKCQTAYKKHTPDVYGYSHAHQNEMPNGERLTIKQLKFIKRYVETGNATQAVIDAGYDLNPDRLRENASVVGADALKKPLVRERVEQALATLKITPEYILKGHMDLAESAFTTDDKGNRKMKSPSHGMVAERSYENLGKLGDLYPKQGNSLELDKDGLKLSWES